MERLRSECGWCRRVAARSADRTWPVGRVGTVVSGEVPGRVLGLEERGYWGRMLGSVPGGSVVEVAGTVVGTVVVRGRLGVVGKDFGRKK